MDWSAILYGYIAIDVLCTILALAALNYEFHFGKEELVEVPLIGILLLLSAPLFLPVLLILQKCEKKRIGFKFSI